MATVGREFGSPDYDRLMQEDATGAASKVERRVGIMKARLHASEDFDAPLPPPDVRELRGC